MTGFFVSRVSQSFFVQLAVDQWPLKQKNLLLEQRSLFIPAITAGRAAAARGGGHTCTTLWWAVPQPLPLLEYFIITLNVFPHLLHDLLRYCELHSSSIQLLSFLRFLIGLRSCRGQVEHIPFPLWGPF